MINQQPHTPKATAAEGEQMEDPEEQPGSASQLKEVEYLETHFYPNKDYIEVDATEFEAQNTMNRAQVYKSAIGIVWTES